MNIFVKHGLQYFNTSDIENNIIKTDGNDILLSTIKNNEFFAEDQQSIDNLVIFKNKILDRYILSC